MQELVLILSSLAGVATAAAVRKMPKSKNQLLSLGASSHIKNQINTLKIEKDILTKTISRLYQGDSEFSKIQKDKLLLKYQNQLGIILAKIEKLEQASNHPDLGPVGDGLITLMDQKLSKLDDRLYELASKMTSAKTEYVEYKTSEIKKQETKENTSNSINNKFDFSTPKQTILKSEENESDSIKPKRSFELTTLTNLSRKEPKFDLIQNEKLKPEATTNQMPEPKLIQSELIKPKNETVPEIVQSVMSKPTATIENKPDIKKEVAKITEYKALPEPPQQEKTSPTRLIDDDFDDESDDLDKIKGDIMRVLSKLDQAEVE